MVVRRLKGSKQTRSYPGQATEQPFSGIALLSPHGEGERKGSLNNALLQESLPASCGRLDIQNCNRKFKTKTSTLRLATWNVRTLLDNEDRHERRTAIVARTLARYSVDIAALSETRFSGETTLEEVGAGYTFFCKGRPDGGLARPESVLPSDRRSCPT